MPLPDLFPFNGDWAKYENDLYEIYLDTVSRVPRRFNGFPIRCRFNPATKGKGYGFWHIISEGRVEEERTPDLRRCERIRWIGWLLDNVNSDERISWWENKRGRETHVVIWIEEADFAVVLAKRTTSLLLLSAYYVKPHRKADFLREREEFLNAQKD